MAWQTPKTDWTSVDGVRYSDLNRMEGNMLELYNIDGLRADRVVYVNASTGNDTTGIGSASAPFKTITKALGSIPCNLNGKSVILSISAGSYPEAVTIKGFDGPLTINGSNGTVNVNSLRVEGCFCTLTNIVLTTSSAVFIMDGASLVGNGSLVVSGSYVRVGYSSRLSLASVACHDNSSFAVVVDDASIFNAMDLRGDNNANGISCQGGSIVAFGDINMEVSSIAYFTAMGGRIYSGAQAMSDLP